jgi:tRNA synthetases class I (E and Q), anti-codon binding domain
MLFSTLSPLRSAPLPSPHRLFTAPSPGKAHEDGDFLKDLNPQSLTLLKSAYVEPSLATAKPGDTFQFERLGYFCMDAEREGESAGQPLLFNRVVTLKDTWAGGVFLRAPIQRYSSLTVPQFAVPFS